MKIENFLPFNGPGLEFKTIQSGITLLAQFIPKDELQSLPPILGSIISNSIPSCSKAPRGLFVLLQVDGIFTVIAISPSSSLRQLSSRYAFDAGQNLPVKEFRYLRTIIVIAGVHQGLKIKLTPHLLNLLTLARRQPLYIPLRVCRDLCFW